MRSACPPLMHVCKYLNFSRSRSEMDLITRRTIAELEGTDKITPELIEIYSNPDSEQYKRMVKTIGDKLSFTSLDFLRLDDLIKSIGIDPSKLCTYCWNGKE
jgi:amidophosphoribosyltransferase